MLNTMNFIMFKFIPFSSLDCANSSCSLALVGANDGA